MVPTAKSVACFLLPSTIPSLSSTIRRSNTILAFASPLTKKDIYECNNAFSSTRFFSNNSYSPSSCSFPPLTNFKSSQGSFRIELRSSDAMEGASGNEIDGFDKEVSTDNGNDDVQREDRSHGNKKSSRNREKSQNRREGRKSGRNTTKSNAERGQSRGGRVFNSYLKIIMDDAYLDALHNMAYVVKSHVDSCQRARHSSSPPPGTGNSKNRQSNRPPLQFKPRSRQSLHMTYFFCGTSLNQMPSQDLIAWHHELNQRLLPPSPSSSSSKHINEQIEQIEQITNVGKNTDCVSNYTLRFHSLSLFPPHRNKLIVAKFHHISPELNGLYIDLCDMVTLPREKLLDSPNIQTSENYYPYPLLRDVTRRQSMHLNNHKASDRALSSFHSKGKEEEEEETALEQQLYRPWVSHVTLGNLVGGTKSDIHKLNLWLKDMDWNMIVENDERNDGSLPSIQKKRIQSHGVLRQNPKAKMNHAKIASSAENAKVKNNSTTTSCLSSKIMVQGLALGGPLPTHVNLDWNFPFYPPPSTTTTTTTT